jgi:hypothetical protein
MDKYRLVILHEEIAQLSKKAPLIDLGEIWQTIPCKRDIYKIMKLDVLNDSFIFHTTVSFEFEIEFPVYIKINHRNLIFKLNPEDYRTHHNQLICDFPKLAKAIESRQFERIKMPELSNVVVTLRPTSLKSAIDIDVRLLDISLLGLGTEVSIVNKDFFQREKEFMILKISGSKIMEQAKFSIRHIIGREDRRLIKIGFASDIMVSQHLMQTIQRLLDK